MNQNEILASVFCIERSLLKTIGLQFLLYLNHISCCGTQDVFAYMVNQLKIETVFCFYQKLYHYMHLPPAVPICQASNICTIVHCDCPTSLPLYPSQPLINLYSAALSLNQLFLRPLSSLSPQRAAGGSHLK